MTNAVLYFLLQHDVEDIKGYVPLFKPWITSILMPQPWTMFCYILLILAGATSNRHSFMGAGWVMSIFSLFYQKIKIVHFNCVYLLNVNCQISKWINMYSRWPKYTNFLSLVQTCSVLNTIWKLNDCLHTNTLNKTLEVSNVVWCLLYYILYIKLTVTIQLF